MLKTKKQVSRLYLSFVLGNLSLTGAWVVILVAQGYNLVEIGLVETVFHITSLIVEIPSGVLADVFGRKNADFQDYYEKYVSNQLILYRLCSDVSTLCAGFALFIGHKVAYAMDILLSIIQILTLLPLYEVRVWHQDKRNEKV